MSKQFLHHFELSAHASQEPRICVSEGVPAEPLLDSEFKRLGVDVLPQDCLSPVWLPATVTADGENPIVEFAVTLMLLPFLERFNYDRLNWNWLLR